MSVTRLAQMTLVTLLWIGWALPCGAQIASPPETVQPSQEREVSSERPEKETRRLASKHRKGLTFVPTELSFGDAAIMTGWGTLATLSGTVLGGLVGIGLARNSSFLTLTIVSAALAHVGGTTLGAYGITASGRSMRYNGAYRHTFLGANLGGLTMGGLMGLAVMGFDIDDDGVLFRMFLAGIPLGMIGGGVLGFYLGSSVSDREPAVSSAPALLNRSGEGWSLGVPAVGITSEGINVWFLGGTF